MKLAIGIACNLVLFGCVVFQAHLISEHKRLTIEACEVAQRWKAVAQDMTSLLELSNNHTKELLKLVKDCQDARLAEDGWQVAPYLTTNSSLALTGMTFIIVGPEDPDPTNR